MRIKIKIYKLTKIKYKIQIIMLLTASLTFSLFSFTNKYCDILA